MTCTDSLNNLNVYLQSLLDANPNVCCQELLMPADVATYTSAVTTSCASSKSTITSSVSGRAYRLHNFDLPIQTFCEFVFRGATADVTSIRTTPLWKKYFENTSTTPPRIDTLSPTSTDEYYLLLAWCKLFQHYVTTAQRVNRNDANVVEMAYQALENDEQYYKDQLDTLYTNQSHDDMLQDIVDNPRACKEVYAQERRQHARERLQTQKRGQRCASKKPTMYVPLNRSAMQCYEHTLMDASFQQEQREWQRKLDDNHVLMQSVEQKRLLGQTIGSALCQSLASLHRMAQLIQSFIDEWQQCTQMCAVVEMPLMRRMAFQQQLKSTLFDLRAMIRQQRTNNIALGENRCDSATKYYPFFNYSTSSCYVPTAMSTSETLVLNATVSLQAYTTEQLVLREVTKEALQAGAVVSKNDIGCVMKRVVQWRYMLLLYTS